MSGLRDATGRTPLHKACGKLERYGERGFWRLEVVKRLIHRGADPNALDNDGVSCLRMASDNVEVMQTLLDAGADVNAGNQATQLGPLVFQNEKGVELLLVSTTSDVE